MHRPESSRLARGRARVLVAVFLVALALRLTSGLWTQGTFWTTGDTQYDLIATNLTRGYGFYTDNIEGLDPGATGVRARFSSFRAPLYPLLLAATYTLVGRHAVSVVLLQAILSALIPVLIYLIARRIHDEPVARGSAAIAAIYPYSVYHDVHLFDTALFELFLAAFVLLLLVIRQQPSWPALASAGVLLG